MSVWGDQLNGRDYNTQRGLSMSINAPPKDARWHHSKAVHGLNNDVVHSDYDTVGELRNIRLAWLEDFTMIVTEERDYRYWRWYDGSGAVRWWERRPINDPLPKTPGFWPNDD